jgi:hypothetical protein
VGLRARCKGPSWILARRHCLADRRRARALARSTSSRVELLREAVIGPLLASSRRTGVPPAVVAVPVCWWPLTLVGSGAGKKTAKLAGRFSRAGPCRGNVVLTTAGNATW